jgi:hypothetical protein
LRKLFIPTAVIGGFLILGLDSEGQLPAHLVTLMSASLLLGEHLPPVRKIWRLSGAHVIMISVMVAPLIILAVAAIGWSVFLTDVVRGYSYRQIITRPILGGGFVTALAVPLINRFGLPAFTIAAAAMTAALIAWGIKRADHGGGVLSQSNAASCCLVRGVRLQPDFRRSA